MTSERPPDPAVTTPGAAVELPRRPLAELHAASNLLWREYWMLRCAARIVSDDAAVTGALEESFALHVRNLDRFLYADDASVGAIAAEDFLGERWSALRPERSQMLADVLAWAEQTLSPPVYARAGASRPARFWTLVQASFELQKVMDTFISNLPRNLLGSCWKVVYDKDHAV